MAKREKRTSRFSQLKTYYDMYEQGMLTEETAKTHIQFAKENNGTVIFESEFEKFAEEYKDDVASGKLDIEKFKNFCTATGALKKSGRKESTVDGSKKDALATTENAVRKGCTDPTKYVALVTAIKNNISELRNIMPKDIKIVFSVYTGKTLPQEQVVEIS